MVAQVKNFAIEYSDSLKWKFFFNAIASMHFVIHVPLPR